MYISCKHFKNSRIYSSWSYEFLRVLFLSWKQSYTLNETTGITSSLIPFFPRINLLVRISVHRNAKMRIFITRLRCSLGCIFALGVPLRSSCWPSRKQVGRHFVCTLQELQTLNELLYSKNVRRQIRNTLSQIIQFCFDFGLISLLLLFLCSCRAVVVVVVLFCLYVVIKRQHATIDT